MINNIQAASLRIAKLRDLINDYRYHYHVLNESIMSEEAADSLKHELSELEAKYPSLITADSPTQRVAGQVLKQFNKYTHQTRMLSLNDVFNIDEVKNWLERLDRLGLGLDLSDLFIDIKMDGLAISLIYEEGQLVTAATRGDGYVGEDVTTNIKTIESIPLKLNNKVSDQSYLNSKVEVRGEVVMYKSDFLSLNEQRLKANLPVFANPRNTAAGTIRQLDPSIVASRQLYFRAYDLLSETTEPATNQLVYSTLQALGFIVNPMAKTVSSLAAISDFINYWRDKRQELEFNTDGLVIKLNNRQDFKRAGIVGKAPRAAIAFKFSAEQATSQLKAIIVSMGRTGVATPVAVLEPVNIAGSLVSMASLHNFDEIERLDVRIGDTVIVHKAGDIIPEIVQPIIELRTGQEQVYSRPTNCPECQYPLEKVREATVNLVCPNPNCPAKTWKKIAHYASRAAVDIRGLADKIVIALINNGLIADQADIYKLKVADLAQLERFGDKSANNLIRAINQARRPQLANFIYGLGIPQVGLQTANDLARHFKNLTSLSQASYLELLTIPGIGEVVADSITIYFSQAENLQLLKKFRDLAVEVQPYQEVESKIANKKIVISGSLVNYSRDEIAKIINQQAGLFANSMSTDVDYLVVGDKPGAAKLSFAKSHNTEIIVEDQLLALLDLKSDKQH